ncbi:MAG: DNA repair protein RecN [Anaerolineae bacterium]|nr:DNA repair protein RecN [Anaerolineae bacterium]
MLIELSISQFAIIESLRLPFRSGFSVLTGETGAGKSIIIDAVSLLLGGRASADMIRTGSEEAAVEGVFELLDPENDPLVPRLEELGLRAENGELILRREISRSRRNMCRINGQAVTLGVLQEIGSHLIDIHGQGDHLSLLQVRHHIDLLDRFGNLWPQREAFGALVARLRQIRREIESLRRDERELARRIDLLTYQIEEIEAAHLKPGEEEELRRQRTLLANAEKRMQLAADIYTLLSAGEEEQRSVTDLMGLVVADLAQLGHLDDALLEESERVESALYQIEDVARTLRRYRDGVEFDPDGLEVIEERLDLLRRLRLKYGDSIEEILDFGRRAQEELEGISHGEERLEALAADEKRLLGEMAVSAGALSQARTEAAERLCRAIEGELADLSMEQGRFAVDIGHVPANDGVELDGQRWHFDSSGIDRVEFLIAPNPGEDLKPLARIASGGETSRLMLAMKTALSSIDQIPTLIFDEVDAGIGGATGSVVGRKLWTLAQAHQVFCVTHLAQIACYAEQHFRVAKEIAAGRTISVAQELSADQRIEELAIMLGGAATETARRNAHELLNRSLSLTTV